MSNILWRFLFGANVNEIDHRPTLTNRISRVVRELVDTPPRIVKHWSIRWRNISPTKDIGRVGYGFWDRARHGKAAGLEISGLLLKPLESKIASYVLGEAPTFKLENKDAEISLNTWMADQHTDILETYQHALGLADFYIIFNGDGTITPKSPDIATQIVDPTDYSKIIGWTFTEVIPHPESLSTMRIEDSYTALERVRVVTVNGKTATTVYPNPLKRIPVVHVANNPSANEVFGRPEGEALVTLLHKYGDVMDAAIKGNIRQGRPTPVIEKMGDAQQVENFWTLMGKRQNQTDDDGTTHEYTEVNFDADLLVTLWGDAVFNWKSPSGFIGETEKLLGLLFYLLVEHTEVPEYVYGNAIASSKASAEAQADPFHRFIQKKRGQAAGWLTQLAALRVAYQGLIDSRQRTDELPTVNWKPLSQEAAALRVEAATAARQDGSIDRATYLALLPLDIEDPAAVVEKAKQETADEADAMRDPTETAIQNLLTKPETADNAL